MGKKLTDRQWAARAHRCIGCGAQAFEFCGVWDRDLGEECHNPICRNCAEQRIQVYLCPKHRIEKVVSDGKAA